jgi:hypothetical protein
MSVSIQDNNWIVTFSELNPLKLADVPIFHLLAGPGCFTQEGEARLYCWIELKTADRNTTAHFTPAMALNQVVDDFFQRYAV